jgi:hypothetical protein
MLNSLRWRATGYNEKRLALSSPRLIIINSQLINTQLKTRRKKTNYIIAESLFALALGLF